MQAGFMQMMYMSEVGCAGGPSEQHLPHLKRTSTTQVISQFFKRIPNLDLYTEYLLFSRLATNSYSLKHCVGQTVLVFGLGSACGPLASNLWSVKCPELF